MYGSAKEYAAENATLKKMWNGPDSIIFAWWNDRYKVSFSHKQNIWRITWYTWFEWIMYFRILAQKKAIIISEVKRINSQYIAAVYKL